MRLKGLELPPVLPPSLRGVINSGQTTPILSPQYASGMATPPVTGVMRMPGQLPMGMPQVPVNIMGSVSGNSVPPSSLVFRSATPPGSG
jgi:hypothetical protein